MLPFLGPIIGAGISAAGSLIGGAMNRSAQAEANEKNYQAQKEFAQKGLRWKIADAKAGGVHPLYAMGAPTQSFSASYVGDQSMGNAIANMGQDIGGAIARTQTVPERVQQFNDQMMTLQLERGTLENELLRSQIRRASGASGPAFPVAAGSHNPVPGGTLSFEGGQWVLNPGTSNSQDIQDRYGDVVENVYGLGVLASDIGHNMERAGVTPPISTESGQNLYSRFSDWYGDWRESNGWVR